MIFSEDLQGPIYEVGRHFMAQPFQRPLQEVAGDFSDHAASWHDVRFTLGIRIFLAPCTCALVC